jgi:solute carrier family 25 carnitine/acylcarnitine transporter 20/29
VGDGLPLFFFIRALHSFLIHSGICLVLVGHPLDLVKVRMQTQTSVNGGGAISMLKSTFAREGMKGLYRGVQAPIVAIAPVFAICFWGYDMGKRVVRAADRNESATVSSVSVNVNSDAADNKNNATASSDYKFSVLQLSMAGALSAIPTTALMAPSERIKCLLQIQANAAAAGQKVQYTSMRDCAVQVYKEGGIRSVYRGTFATLLRDVPGSMAYFGVYEWMKLEICKMQNKSPTELSPVAVLTAGGLAGMANWIVSIPPDVLKSRYQTAPHGKYSGLLEVYKEVVRDEGHAGLFRGLRPALLRAFPANAACFFGMEMSRSLLSFMD